MAQDQDFESFLQSNAPAPSDTGAAAPTTVAPAAAGPGTDPFESFLADQQSQQAAAVKSQAQGISTANSQQSADAAGRAASTGRQIGVPGPVVETDPERYEQQAKAQNNTNILAANPKLAGWVVDNPFQAKIAQDQYQDMANMGDVLSGNGVIDYAKSLAKGVAGSFVNAGLSINRAIAQGIANQTGYQPTQDKFQSDWWYKNMIQPQLGNQAATALAPDASFGAKAVYTIGGMLGTLAQIAATGGTSAEAEAATAVPTAAQAIGQQIAHGARAMAFPALTEALTAGKDAYDKTGDTRSAILAATVAYSTATLGGVVPLGAEGNLATRAATGFISGAVTGEVSRQAQNLVNPEQQPFNPEQTILSGLSGSILAGAMGRSPMHDAVRQAYSDGIDAETAQRGAATIQQVSDISAASKLREHDPEAFRDYVARMAEDGPIENVYIDGQTFADALHQSAVDPDQVPGLNDRIDEAVRTGGDVQIPIADYATHIAGTDLDKAIQPELKAEEGGMTFSEGQKFFENAQEEMQARADELVKSSEPQTQQDQDVKQIGDTLFDQMKATGRYPDYVARASLAPVTEFYRTMADRTGTTPGELYKQFPLKIAGENPAGETLNQSRLPEEISIGPGGIKTTPRSGETLFHETSSESAALIIADDMTNHAHGVRTSNLFVTNDRDLAIGQGGQGVHIEFDGGAVSAKVHEKPGTGVIGGNEFKADAMANNAISKVTVPEGSELPLSKTQRANFLHRFDKATLPDGSTEYTRKPTKILNQGERGGFSPDSNTIGLLKGADLSTFLHESGHFFLSTLGDLAGRADAPGPIRDDMDTAIKWMGGKDLADWQGKTLEEQRDMHEKFARGFETYLMEGKAPSLELQGLFSRFRSWLINVYRSVSGLGADLSPEVRGVFDRLLASDDAIRQAEVARGYASLDLSKTDATDQQKSWYAQEGDRATQEALDQMDQKTVRDMKWASNAKSKALKALQAEANDVRDQTRREVTRSVMSQPIYQAWQFLTLRGPEEFKALPEAKEAQTAHVDATKDNLFQVIAKFGGLNRDEVKSEWGVDHREIPDSGIFGKPIVRKSGGLSIDRMAERLVQEHFLDAEDRTEFEEKFDAQRTGRDQFSWEHAYKGEEGPIQPLDIENAYHGKLDTKDLKNMYGDAADAPWRELTKRGMTSAKTGIDSDILAETFGLSSGREMVDQLMNGETPYQAIKRQTDERMLQEHGELTDPKAIDDAANAAVANEARARFMATGLKLLAKSPIPVRDLVKAATDAANTAIAAKRVGDVNPRQFEVAEAKANKEAIDQAPKNPAEAVKAQRQALLSNRLAKAARDAVAEIKKIVNNQKRYDKDSIRAKMDPDILEQIDDLRDRFDFRQKPLAGPTKAETSLQTWMDTQQAFGYAPVQNASMIDPSVRMHYKDMTVEQIRGFNDTIRSMEQIARERKSIMIEGKKVDLAEAVGTLVDKMKEQPDQFSLKELIQPPRAGVDPLFKVVLDRMASFLRSAVSELKPQQFKANQFDRQQILGPFTRTIFQRVFDANYHKIDMLKSVANDFRAAADNLGREWQDSLTDLVANHSLVDADLTQETGQTVYRQLTRGDMLGVARHVGNESNFDKLTKGMGWEPADVWSFLSTNMTAKDWQATQATWDAFDRHWPDMVEMNRRLGNVSPDRIEPRPFRTSSGIDMKGGYAPIDYDPLRSKLAVRKSDASAINPAEGLFGKGYFRADTTTNGSLNARTGYYDRLDLGFNSIERRLHDTIHDLAYREALLDTHKVLSSADFRRQFNLTYGPEQYKSMQEWVGNLANGQNSDAQMSKLAQIMQATRHMVVANGIALRISTMIKHGGSAAFKSAGYFSGGGQKYFASRAARMATDHEGQTSSAIEKFSEIRARSMQQDRDYKQTTASLFQPEGFQSKAERFGHAGVAYLDLLSAVPTAWGAYDRAITEGIPKNRGGTGQPMTDEDATAYANQIVREAHGSNIESARSAILENKSEMTKMLTMMYGFMNNSLGQVMDMSDKLKTAGFSKPEVLARFLMASIVPALAAGVVEKQHKNEGWAEWAGKAITGEFAGMVPGIRDAWSALKGYNSAGLSPLMATLSAGGKPFRDAYEAAQGKTVKTPIKDLGNAIGLGIPGAGQVGTTLQYAADLKSGKAKPQGPVDVVRGLALGQNNQ